MIRRPTDLPKLNELSSTLLNVKFYRIVRSLLTPFVCCGVYFYCAVQDLWFFSVCILIYLSFITYASVSHDLVHRTLKLPKFWNHFFLTLIELLALRSGHAYQRAHLHHHRTFPTNKDIEGNASKLSFLSVLFCGITFQVKIWLWALKAGGRKRTLVLMEGLLCFSIILGALLLYNVFPIFFIYVSLMIVGSWVIPFFTSYIPHDPFQEDLLKQTRLFRGRIASFIAMEHLYHLEHHLYPTVPHHNWPKLAKLLDPYFERKEIKSIRFLF